MSDKTKVAIPRRLVSELAQWVADEQGHWPEDTAYQEDLLLFATTLAQIKGESHD